MAGKGAGEVDGGAVLLTGYSICGEEGPRVELDVRGRLPSGGAVAAGGGGVRFGRVTARTRTGWDGGASRRG